MLKFASDLPDDHEYAIVCWGQSNFTPNGTYAAGTVADTYLVQNSVGYNVLVTGRITGSGTETFVVTNESLGALTGNFVGGELRLGTPTAPRRGYGIITAMTTLSLTVEWQDAPDLLAGQTSVSINNSGTTATVTHANHGMIQGTSVLIAGASAATHNANNGTFRINTVVDANTYTYETSGLTAGAVAGSAPGFPTSAGIASAYIYYRDQRNSRYKNVRVLQAFLPNAVQANPTAASPIASPSSAYAIPASIDSYDKLALFEDFTFAEGISGFGVYAPGSTPGANTIVVEAGVAADLLIGGYCRVESYDGSGVLTKVSTGIVASHANVGGDGFTTTTSEVSLASEEFDLGASTHGFVTGQLVWATPTNGTTDTYPTTTPQINETTPLYAIRVDDNEFKVASSYANAIAGVAITLDATAASDNLTWRGGTTLTMAANWSGGTPSGTSYKVEVWIPHWFDHPYAYEAGPGFLHPTNEPEPKAAVYSRPRGNTTLGWGSPNWGTVLPYASRLADAIGKRINVIHLAVDSTGIISTAAVHTGTSHGWLVNGFRKDWNPSNASGLANRLKNLITVSAPAALTAEGNTKTLRILAIAGMQGETEATTAVGREQYKNLLPSFYNWLKKTIFDAGLSYYSAVERMPIVHAGIYKAIWESAGASTDDTNGVINSAITNFTAKTEFAGTIDVNSSTVAGIHFDAVGESRNGSLLAAETVRLIDSVLSSENDLDDADAIEICNLALSYVGDKAKIQSLNTTTDTSTQAYYCAKFYPEARNMLLQQMAWSFATRREALVRVDDARSEEWAYAYGVPDNAVRVFAVLPPEAGDDVVRSASGTSTSYTSTGELRTTVATGYVERPFTIEQDDDGHRIIYTDTENAVARFNALMSDAKHYPPLFRDAVALKMAAMLAGPLLKGVEGAQVRQVFEDRLMATLEKAKTHDAVQHDPKPEHTPRQIRARWSQ